MVDLALLGYSALAALCVAITAVLVTNRDAWWPFVSGQWRASIDRARQQKAAREALYGYAPMSSRTRQSAFQRKKLEQHSYAAEPSTEHVGTRDTEPVSTLWEQLGTLSDDQLLDILARIHGPDGELRFADSRLAKFIGGRVEDRIAQVRAVRGVDVQPKSAPVVYATPIVGRVTNAQFEPRDPDYPYQSPA